MKYKSATQILSHAMTTQQKYVQASLHISWTLTNIWSILQMLILTKSVCLMLWIFCLKIKRMLPIEIFQYIPISTSTNTSNTIVLSENNHKLLKQDLPTPDFSSLALDESYDITDTAQLMIHVWYLNRINGKFYKKLLTHLPFGDHKR